MTNQALEAAAFAIIAQRIAQGSTVLGYWPLSGGVSAVVHALEISATQGRERFVVRRQGAHWTATSHQGIDAEFQLLVALHKAGLPVPKPVLLDVTGEILPLPFMVMGMVDGSTSIPDERVEPAMRQMSHFLAYLHRLDVNDLALPSLKQREDPIEGVLQYLAAESEDAVLREVLTSYRVHKQRPSLLHGDFWPGNLLWSDGQLASVIDWEDAAIGPPASDVACCRAELNAMFGESCVNDFTQHYRAASGDELRDLPLWDVYVGLSALAHMHRWGLPPEVEADRRARTLAFVARATQTLLSQRPWQDPR